METVYDFKLPKGYMDSKGELHREGRMRLATAGDELSAAKDPRVAGNEAYIIVVLLSKVITQLEGVEMVTPTLIEKLFTADLAFLQDMYEKINNVDFPQIEVICPDCGKVFTVPVNFTAEE